jgi:dTDP-4-dehydrorhamnose reductase
MRILVLGGDGMLGHQLLKVLQPTHDVRVTLHRPLDAYRSYGLFDAGNSFPNIDARSTSSLAEVLAELQPEAVVNCIGLIKQRDDTKDVIANLEVNALLPHRLAELCAGSGTRLIQISTDCVFSGRKGMYKETDVADAEDAYGRTKLLGEVTGSNCLTLRTSIIGRELARKRSLLEWFIAQNGRVKGFRKAIFSGFSTVEFSRVVKMMLERFESAEGLFHVSSEPINKYDLLNLFREQFGTPVEIEPDDALAIDRSLDSSRFRSTFGYVPPTWRDMLVEL